MGYLQSSDPLLVNIALTPGQILPYSNIHPLSTRVNSPLKGKLLCFSGASSSLLFGVSRLRRIYCRPLVETAPDQTDNFRLPELYVSSHEEIEPGIYTGMI